MNQRTKLFTYAVLLFMLLPIVSFAATPQTINYQGILKDNNGALVNGTVQMQFALYSSLSGTSVLWSELQSSVTVTNGRYNVILGSVTPIALPFDAQYYLGVTVGADLEMSPRQALTNAPYAMRAAKAETLAYTGAVYRWQVFDTYSQDNWMAGNNASLFGGVPPSNWTDSNGNASQMSSDKEVLRTLLTNRGYAGKNALVISNVYYYYSSTNGRVVVTLFRIRNTTANPINWTPYFYYTAYAGWGETASIALNGALPWSSSGVNTPSSGQATSVTLSIPANRTSTIIFAVPSGTPNSPVRATFLAFYNNSLQLPAGLEYVDDLDTATGGWEQ
jgi:hypothetical protein